MEKFSKLQPANDQVYYVSFDLSFFIKITEKIHEKLNYSWKTYTV